MSQIKKFTDKIAVMEGRNAREVILTLSDAKALRDEILSILLEQREQGNKPEEVITVVMNGGKW
jgi:hypothetical protein